MTRIVFYKTDGVFYGFEEQGHTGYGEEGDDVLCAALSAMTMLIINAIEVSYATDVEYTLDEKSGDIRLVVKGALPAYQDNENKRYAASGLIMAYYYQLNDLIEEYGEYLSVDVIDRPL